MKLKVCGLSNPVEIETCISSKSARKLLSGCFRFFCSQKFPRGAGKSVFVFKCSTGPCLSRKKSRAKKTSSNQKLHSFPHNGFGSGGFPLNAGERDSWKIEIKFLPFLCKLWRWRKYLYIQWVHRWYFEALF